MPGFRTHYLFGKLTQAKTGLSYHALHDHPHCFNLGQQGPDIFFYCPPSHLFYHEHLGGHLHHRNTLAFFAALFEGRSRFPTKEFRSICDAYIMGFIGHYTLDTIMHPYIHYRCKKRENHERPLYAFGIHVMLETDIDKALLEHYLHKKPSEFHCADTITLSKKEQLVISLLLSFAIRRAYPEFKPSAAHMSYAISCTRLVNRLLHDPTGHTKTLVRMLDRKMAGTAIISPLIATDTHQTYNDPCNLTHQRWRNPWRPTKASTKDVYALMKQAGRIYRNRLSLYYDMMVRLPENYFYCQNTLLTDLENLSYDTGLVIQKGDPFAAGA